MSYVANLIEYAIPPLPKVDAMRIIPMDMMIVTLLLVESHLDCDFARESVPPIYGIDPLVRITDEYVSHSKSLV